LSESKPRGRSTRSVVSEWPSRRHGWIGSKRRRSESDLGCKDGVDLCDGKPHAAFRACAGHLVAGGRSEPAADRHGRLLGRLHDSDLDGRGRRIIVQPGRPKYVLSTSLNDPEWEGTSVITGDVDAAIRELKAQEGGDFVVPGSGALVRWLLAIGLVDQLDLLVYPVIIGQGMRLFADSGPDIALDLVSSRTTSRGITIQTYRTAGRPEYARSTARRDA